MSLKRVVSAVPIAASSCVGSCTVASETVLESKSPDGRYSVKLVGQPGEPSFFFEEKRVYLDAHRGDVALVQSEEIHFAGFLDSGFHNSFDKPIWSGNNVLWFPTNRGRPT